MLGFKRGWRYGEHAWGGGFGLGRQWRGGMGPHGFGGPCWWYASQTKEVLKPTVDILKAKLEFLNAQKSLLEKYIAELETQAKEENK
jgi:hypothetical protein